MNTGNEPIVFLNALGVLLFAVLSFLVDGGILAVTPDQQGAIKAAIGAVIALVVTVVSRSQVTPTSKL